MLFFKFLSSRYDVRLIPGFFAPILGKLRQFPGENTQEGQNDANYM